MTTRGHLPASLIYFSVLLAFADLANKSIVFYDYLPVTEGPPMPFTSQLVLGHLPLPSSVSETTKMLSVRST